MAVSGIGSGGHSRIVDGLRTQVRVVGALMVRDALSRYGHSSLGFFWTIGEPLMLTGGVMLMWSLLRMSHGSEVGVVPFALTGYTFLTMWRHIVFKSVRVMSRNSTLAYHRQVKRLDVILAKSVLEVVSIGAAFTVAYIPFFLLGACPPLRDPLVLIGGFVLSAWFATGFGLVMAGLSELSESAEHFVQPVMYITIPLTGTFTMMEWLPDSVRGPLSWSPLVNGVEMYRSGLFSDEVTTYWSAGYLVACAALATVIGLALFRYAERLVEI